jgi:hypothetical protein
MRPATAYGSWCSLDAAADDVVNAQSACKLQSSCVFSPRAATTSNRSASRRKRGLSASRPPLGELPPARCLEEQVRPNEPTPS